jgi:hypothetical protein
MSSQTILDWLDYLPDEYLPADDCIATSLLPTVSLPRPSPPPEPLERKRRHGQQAGAQANIQLSSPPLSSASTTMDADSTPISKRPRLASPATDLSDPTPRPRTQTANPVMRSANLSQSSRSYSTTSRSRSEASSRSLSPKKQLMKLAASGLDIRPLDIDTAPEAATELLFRLQNVHDGTAILPVSLRDEVLSASDPARGWRYSFKTTEEPDTLPGRIPSKQEASHIHKSAINCQAIGQDELGWNMEVHHPILESVFREQQSLSLPGCPINFAPCTSARTHKTFVPASGSAKMVDFCIYYDTDARDGDDDKEQQLRKQALRDLCLHMPTTTVNHTDFRPVQLHPIVISIETKKPGTEPEQSGLQLAVWLTAQWASLQQAAYVSIRASRRRENVSSDEASSAQEQIDMVNLAEARVRELPFIPSLTVQGHKWSLVLSTREGKQTVLWTEMEFGSTQSLRSTYQVIAGLREIAAWARDIYMPWWRKNVLDGLMGPRPEEEESEIALPSHD